MLYQNNVTLFSNIPIHAFGQKHALKGRFSGPFLQIPHLKIPAKLPEIPLHMSVCDGSDSEDVAEKQEPIDSDTVKSEEEFLSGFKSEDAVSDSHDKVADTQFQKVTESGML